MLNTIDEGIKAVRQGKIVIVVDDENRENEKRSVGLSGNIGCCTGLMTRGDHNKPKKKK